MFLAAGESWGLAELFSGLSGGLLLLIILGTVGFGLAVVVESLIADDLADGLLGLADKVLLDLFRFAHRLSPISSLASGAAGKNHALIASKQDRCPRQGFGCAVQMG